MSEARAVSAAKRVRAAPEAEGGADRNAFAAALFARGDQEDLARYTAEELAAIAADAFDFLTERRPGEFKIRLFNPGPVQGGRELHRGSVLEIANDDMAFLVDSVTGELAERGLELRMILHPILSVERDASGRLVAFHGEGHSVPEELGLRESFIHVQLERIEDEDERAVLLVALRDTLRDVRQVVADWRPMLERLEAAIASFKASPPPIPAADLAEAVQFLDWLKDENFIFLGMREYHFLGGRARGRLEAVPDTGLGLLRDPELLVLRRGRALVSMTPEIRDFLLQPVPLIITKANVRSRVHRRVHMDYVGVKTFSDKGQLSGELRIVGLFTSEAYTRMARSIPVLRRKVANILERAGLDPDSHSGKALAHVLETYPRDELFQIDEDTLYASAMSILKLEERPRIRVLTRFDRFERFVSVLVFVPRDRFSTDVRIKIGDHLAAVFKGRLSAAYPHTTSAGPLARIHYIIGRHEGEWPRPPQSELEAGVAAIVTTWGDRLKRALGERYDPARARALRARYAEAFSAGYQEAFGTELAVEDIARLERLSPERRIAVHLHRRADMDDGRISLKLYHHGGPIPLSERLPVLENMGFRAINERSYRIAPAGEKARIWLHDIVLERAGGGPIDLPKLGPALEACYMAVWRGLAESDGYNALVLAEGLGWRDVAMLRALSRYLRQIRIPYSQDYMWATLVRHAGLSARLVDLFHARFSPTGPSEPAARAAGEQAITEEIEAGLAEVTSLDEDRILRRFANAVQSMLRTNFFQVGTDGGPKATFAFKFDSRRIEKLPEPRPLFEISVYGPAVEGIYLRFGRIARGGIRWSDRPQDFRTEILGLVKAQQVKNAVIVPVGAKGGFVPKRRPADPSREAVQAEGIAAYKTFINCLLDVTDNLKDDVFVPPENTVRHDADDAYLVVAADKGTATFSDTANAIAEERGFWLADAFASGGSAGYDHKAMGITARGAWEAVKRHFAEKNVDIQSTPFTVAGVGDMSGDVFGNGMLLSRHIKLVAAFDHRDIFIDPDPDTAASFAERERLFRLPRSSWADYDRSKLSAGGAVFSRAEKSIELSRHAQTALGLDQARATPQEIMSAVLRAPVDLLWFGGIGTYVRASDESDEQIGDRANDAVRVAARELRAKVVGEGANLGVSQRGRIEFARAGGRINTDAIDNSAGVNTSDLEVNIKITLAPLEASGSIKRPARNRLLASMTEEVAALVLRNNSLQALAISLAERRGLEDLGFAQRLMNVLEDRGLLNRAVEFLPSDAQLAERAKRGEAMTRPEIAVLLAWSKIALFGDLLDSDVPDDDYLSRELMRYFPVKLQRGYPQAIEGHRLRREIIATMLSNSMINRGGPTLLVRVADATGAESPKIAAAFAAVRDSFDMTALNAAVDGLAGTVDGALQLSLHAEIQDLLLGQLVWFLRFVPLDDGLSGLIEHYRRGIEGFTATLATGLPEGPRAAFQDRRERLAAAGVPDPLADRLVALPFLPLAPDITLVADRTGRPPADATKTFFAVDEALALDRVAAAARGLAVSDYYDRLALERASGRIGEARRRLTIEALQTGRSGAEAVAAWIDPRRDAVERTQAMVAEILATATPTVSKLSVAAGLVGDLAGL